ncbi:MAG: HAMP domain-containing histidine kinase [Ruminococcus sp.]|nr:HAMP domain-containing histidine kinase [Ruminococcus sp.]
MKLWQNIFLSSLLLMILTINIVSAAVLSSSHKMLLEREQAHAVNEYEFFAASFSNAVIYERLRADEVILSEEQVASTAKELFFGPDNDTAHAAVFSASDRRLVAGSGFDELMELGEVQDHISGYSPDPDTCQIRIFTLGKSRIMTVTSAMTVEGRDYIVITALDVSDIYAMRDRQRDFVRKVSIISAAIVSLILLVTVIILLRPLSRLNIYTKAIAGGNYKIRIRKKGSIEFRELSGNMNAMADSIQRNAARLEKTAEDRQTFIANLAHEMKTPLTSILGFGDLLRIKKNVSDSERMEYAGVIVEETKRLRSLSGKLMELVALGGTETEMEPVALRDIFRDLEAAFAPQLSKNGLTLYTSSEEITVMADQELLISLLSNLIENAVKASSEGKRIALNARHNGDGRVLISVADEGIGMSQEAVEKVFQPFYMVDKSRSRKAGGAGLGLALCEKIASVHGAELSVTSEIGKGTTVSLLMKEVEPS